MLVGKLKAKHDELASSKLPADEVAKLLKAGAFLVDVRPKIQAKMGMAPGATNISIFTLKRRLHELPRDRKIVLYCHSGAAAGKAKDSTGCPGIQGVQRRRLQGHPEDRREIVNGGANAAKTPP